MANENKYLNYPGVEYLWDKIKTQCAVSNGPVTLVGGPLSGSINTTNWPSTAGWRDSNGNPVIPRGATLEDILTNLFSKILWPTNASIHYGWSTSITKNPSVKINSTYSSATNAAATTVEVGTQYFYNGATVNQNDVTYNVYSTGCTYGYKLGSSDTVEPSGTHINNDYNKSYTCEQTGGQISDVVVTGFKSNAAGTTDVTIPSNSYTTAINSPMYVSEGSNYVTVSQSGPTYTPSSDPESTWYLWAASNTGAYDSENQVYEIDAPSVYASKTGVTATGSITSNTITGARRRWYGFLATTLSISSSMTTSEKEDLADAIRNEMSNGYALSSQLSQLTGGSGTTMTTPSTGFRSLLIAVPTTDPAFTEIKQVGAPTDLLPGMSTITIDIPGKNDFSPISYTVYYRNWDSVGESNKQYTIN